MNNNMPMPHSVSVKNFFSLSNVVLDSREAAI